MSSRLVRSVPMPATPVGVARFEARVVLGGVALLLGAIPFLTLMLLVRGQWTPLQDLDHDVARTLNERASASTVLVDVLQVVTELGGNVFAVYAFALATLWFLIRRRLRPASYVATTGIGLAVLVPLTKALIGRPRPQVALPVVEIPSNASFPSGHATVSLVLTGMLTLLLLPAVPRRLRPMLVSFAAALTVAVGATRLALGVHFVSDVLAGWALGAAWLAVTTAAFRAWQRTSGLPVRPVSDGIDLRRGRHATPQLEGAAARLEQPRVRALLASAAVLLAALTALGLLMTSALTDTVVARLDASLVQQALDIRTEHRTQLARAVSSLSGTPMVIAMTVGMSVIVLALRLGRRPVIFIATVVLGEVLLYFAVSRVVDRARPDVPDLTSGLPVAASWPSGHTAAAVAVYGALAVLVLLYSRSRWRRTVLLVPLVLPVAVAVSRVYVAAHRPTDVLAGLMLGALWLLACVHFLLRPAPAEAPTSRLVRRL